MILQLMRDNILVEPVADTTKETVSGLVLPDTSKRATCRGIVRSVGPTCRVHSGQSVVFNPRVGTEVEEDGLTHVIMSEKDILSIVE